MRRYIEGNRGLIIDGNKVTLMFSDTPIEIILEDYEIPFSSINATTGVPKKLQDQVIAFADRELEGYTYQDFQDGIKTYQTFFLLGKYLPFRPSYMHLSEDFEDYLTSSAMNFYNIQATGYYYLNIEWLKKYTYDLIEFLTAWESFFILGDITIPQMSRISVSTSAKVTDYKLLAFQSQLNFNIECESSSGNVTKSCEWSG